jgi:PAS domain S-box-containing protein
MTKQLRVLLLEDNRDDADFVQKTLVDGGLSCHVTLAQTRDEFTNALQEGSFHLILADYVIPGFDGMAALKMVQEKCPDCPFIFVSGVLGEDAAIASMREGATDYVPKHKLSRLVPAAERALREARERRERRRAERKLHQTGQLLQAIFSSAPVAITMVDPHGKVLMWSSAAQKIFGWTAEEVVGHPLPTLLPDREEEFFAILRAVLMGQILTGFETQARKKDGSVVTLSLSCAPVRDPNGKTVGVVRIESDHTEHKRKEKELEESEQKYQAVFNDSLAALCLATMDGKVVDVNPAWLRMLGYAEKSDAIGRDIAGFILPQDRGVLETWLKALPGALAGSERLRQVSKDGTVIDVEANVCEVSIPGKRAFLITARDITGRQPRTKP